MSFAPLGVWGVEPGWVLQSKGKIYKYQVSKKRKSFDVVFFLLIEKGEEIREKETGKEEEKEKGGQGEEGRQRK